MLTENAASVFLGAPRSAERAAPEDLSGLYETMGRSPQVSRIHEQVALVAPTDFSVLIDGETGSGKELVARALHGGSARRNRPLVPVDCGSIPPTLIESELFGHEKGAFTGADRTKLGKFEVADGSTLFLDEISNLPLDVQPKLLRALQEKQIWRVGGMQPIAINTRVLAACNQELLSLVRAKKFRDDLYHRLNEFSIRIPALRERIEDIEHLALRFVALTNQELRKQVTLSRAALEMLLAYSWPGNVRELRNCIRRAVLQARTEIWPEHLALSHGHSATSAATLRQRRGVRRKPVAQGDRPRGHGGRGTQGAGRGAAADAGEQGQGSAAAAGGLQDDSREDQELWHLFNAKRRDSDRAVSETGETSERRRSWVQADSWAGSAG